MDGLPTVLFAHEFFYFYPPIVCFRCSRSEAFHQRLQQYLPDDRGQLPSFLTFAELEKHVRPGVILTGNMFDFYFVKSFS